MEDILKKIVAHKRSELHATDFGDIELRARACTRPVISISSSLRSSKGGIIAEFKRRSPSKGWIKESGDPRTVVAGYAAAGAAASSVLTNEEFFGGRIDDLIAAREAAPELALLRKEFIVDARRIYEARVAGADGILLIAACLSIEQCRELAQVAHSLGLEVLLEVHDECELGHINEFVDILGVNNRNLKSFATDTEHSKAMVRRMREAAGGDIVIISESGITGAAMITELREAGFEGFLMGEHFMRYDNPAEGLVKLLEEL